MVAQLLSILQSQEKKEDRSNTKEFNLIIHWTLVQEPRQWVMVVYADLSFFHVRCRRSLILYHHAKICVILTIQF